MAHAQKPDFVCRRNGRVHLNRLGRQFSRLLAAEACASAVVMLVTPCSEVVWEYWLPTPFASIPFTSPPVRHRVPSHFNWTLPSIGGLHVRSFIPCRRTTLEDRRRKVCAIVYKHSTLSKPFHRVMLHGLRSCSWSDGYFTGYEQEEIGVYSKTLSSCSLPSAAIHGSKLF
jgi:hypothetical protein